MLCYCMCRGFLAAWSVQERMLHLRVLLHPDGLSLPEGATRGITVLLCPCLGPAVLRNPCHAIAMLLLHVH